MIQSHRTSAIVLMVLMFLLPIFFIPGGVLPLDVSKSALFALGTILVALAFLTEYFTSGKITIAWHPLILSVILLPLVYLASALTSANHALSLFGYALEPGTFGFLLLAAIIFLVTSFIVLDMPKVRRAIWVMLASIGLVSIFTIVKILTNGTGLVLGQFAGNMSTPLGRWTDLGTIFALTALLTGSAVSMLPAKKPVRILFIVGFIISLILTAVVSFSSSFLMLLIGSVFLFVYLLTKERHITESEGGKKSPLWPAWIMMVVSLLLFINPVISSTGTVTQVISHAFNVNNTDVRPSLSATLTVSKGVLSKDVLLGSGPNTFDRDWLIHKPVDINSTPFWGAVFPYGIGFVPTQVASTGVLGTLLWTIFFVLLLALGVKSLRHLPESKGDRFLIISTLLSTIILWLAAFLYVPSEAVITLAFIFSALFLAAARSVGIVSSRQLIFSRGTSANVASAVFGIILVVGSIILGFAVFQRTVSAYHFNKALALSNTPGAALSQVESELNKALSLSPQDIYYAAVARVNFAKAQTAVSDKNSAAETRQKLFQDSISASINAARLAAAANPGNYGNWVLLGSVYSSLVSNPPSIEGAYESAKNAYEEALKLNPKSPEVPLLLARTELAKGDIDAARSHAREAIALKADYADAHLFLAQLELSANNLPEAIKSAESWALLTPNDPSVFFELGLLKYANKDYQGAGGAMLAALQLEPNYANAQYYLGLSLVQLGELENAKVVFQQLAKTNPDNADVQSILASLEKGKAPNLNAKTDSTATRR